MKEDTMEINLLELERLAAIAKEKRQRGRTARLAKHFHDSLMSIKSAVPDQEDIAFNEELEKAIAEAESEWDGYDYA